MLPSTNTSTEEYISALIHDQQENEFVDFKQFYYHDEKKYDLIKDIVSFSNVPSSIDKFIIFGIADETWDVVGINASAIPDVSEINDLLHTYVEPFVYIEVGQITYEGKTIGYIKIPASHSDRPYVIKKEYRKHGQTYLRCGEIYVRKNASNFIATRRDLDYIYRNNGAFNISVYDSTVDIGIVQIRNDRGLFVQLRIVLANNISHTINICRITCDLCTARNRTQYECSFCADKTRRFERIPSPLSSTPLQLTSGLELQKSLYFQISEECTKHLLEKHRSGEKFLIKIELFDVNENKYASQPTEIRLCFYGDANVL